MASEEETTSKLAQLRDVTGCSEEQAASLLEACDNNLELAADMFMESSSTEPTTNTEPQTEEEELRPPIPPKQETLVEFDAASNRANVHRTRIKSVFDSFRNFSSEAGMSFSGLPGESSSSSASSSNPNKSKKRALEELFKPPLDLIVCGDLSTVREIAAKEGKWLMVNIQDAREFACQTLNRDVWSKTSVKALIRESFVLWQQYRESLGAEHYMRFYQIAKWPHVAVLDPRTGEKLAEFNNLPDADVFVEVVNDFLAHHPLWTLNGENGNARNTNASKRAKVSEPATSLVDADEAAQLEAAIKASLQETAAVPQSDDESSCDSNYLEAVQTSETDEPKIEEDWKAYLGEESDTSATITFSIRYPNGEKEVKAFPSASKIKALVLYVASKGYARDSYEVVKNFPRIVLSEEKGILRSMGELDLAPKEAVFVQKISTSK